MFDKLVCFDCGEKGHLYMGLSEFSKFYCRHCDFDFDSDDITEYVTERREGRAGLGNAKMVEQVEEWQKVLDFILGG